MMDKAVYNMRGLWVAIREDNKQKVKGHLINNDGRVATIAVNHGTLIRSTNNLEFVRVIPQTLGECTCLCDKKGKVLFEGDMVYSAETGEGIIRFGEYANPFGGDSERHIGFYIDWRGEGSISLRRDLGYWVKENRLVYMDNARETFDF